MKVDKDTLVKQRFWVGLGAFALLWLIVLMVALFSAGDKAAANAKEVKGKKDAVSGLRDIKNESYTSLVAEKKEELQGKKNVVWEQAWKGQVGVMFWPRPRTNSEVWRRLEEQGYFGEEIAPGDRTDYRNTGVYDSQLPVDGDEGIRRALAPIQAKGGNDAAAWNQLIRRATFDNKFAPTNEDVWLAQEDLWVQFELLSVVKAALDSAALFENVTNFKRAEAPKEPDKPAAEAAGVAAVTPPAAEDAKKPVVLRQRFRNPHWQLDLVLEQNDKQLTVTPQTTLKSLDAGPAQPVAGLDLQVGQWAAQAPPAQHLVFEGKPDGKGLLALAKPVALAGFAPNVEDVPFVVTLAADKGDPPPAKEGSRRYRYRNPNWEVELLLERAPDGQYFVSDKSKVTNISASQRTLPISSAKFAVRQAGRYLTDVTVPDEWLAAGSTTETKRPSGHFVLPEENKPVEVYQVFNWDTSPIKRLDALELPGGTSFNSHRTSNLALKPAVQFPIPEAPKEAAPAGGAGGGMMGGVGGAGMGSGPGGPGAGPDTSKTPNGLVRNRYISVTEQVRHMPVALELVVDQAHVQDVLTAVVNSRLRIQITQVQWRRIRGVKSSGGDDTLAGGMSGGMGPGMPGGMGPGMYGPGRGSSGGMGSSPPSGYNPGGGYGPGMPGGMGGAGMSGGSGRGPTSPMGRGGYGGGSSSPGPGGVGGAGSTGPKPPGTGSDPGSSRGANQPSAGDDSDPNLVQLAVYGIAALYERYPPKPKAEPAAGGAAATPPAAK